MPNTHISKFLSFILRHHPEDIGLTLDRDGWADIGELLDKARAHGREIDRETLHQVVAENDKKRFTVSDDGTKIRAEQGHSTRQVDIAYQETQPPEILYHGTATRFLDSILQQGLKPGSRHYVHLSDNMETAVKVGQRHGKVVVLTIRAGEMYRQGFKFYLTQNHVWLSDAVPCGFIDMPDSDCSE